MAAIHVGQPHVSQELQTELGPSPTQAIRTVLTAACACCLQRVPTTVLRKIRAKLDALAEVLALGVVWDYDHAYAPLGCTDTPTNTASMHKTNKNRPLRRRGPMPSLCGPTPRQAARQGY